MSGTDDRIRASADAAFDQFAGAYEAALDQGLSVSGEGRAFFAEGRIGWLRDRLTRLGRPATKVLDFGCGTGASAPLLRDLLGADRVVGEDVSRSSIEVAQRDHGGPRIAFRHMDVDDPVDAPDSLNAFDVAYCNGVFHHIPVDERPAAVRRVHAALRPGGVFALWENNPWNPGTRLVMRRIPFDRDAVLVWPAGARRLLRDAGFEIVCTRFLFVFPHALRGLRRMERWMSALPIGAQYVVLARRPPR